jgi:plastocyanin
MKKNAVIVVAVLIIVLAAAGFYFATRPTTHQITLQAFEYFFTEPGVSGNNPTITVNSGDTVVLTIQNLGTKDHEFFVLTQSDYNNYIKAIQNGQSAEEPAPAFKEASVEDVGAGESKTGTFVAGATGTYVYACLDKSGTEPLLHAHKGMFGTFQVQSGGIFSLARTFESIFSNTFSVVPSIVLWQAAIVLSLAAVIKRQ